ncbi:MAG: hypothetical protein ACE15B_17680 [Bryobacteraceae bacterium]
MKPARASKLAPLAVFAALAALSAAAVWFFHSRGQLLYYGDAEAHLNIARRIFDSRTPGYDQIGTVWLPLPHLMMLPLVRDDAMWRSGLAGSIPTAACFVLAGLFLYLAARRAFRDSLAALVAVAAFALNPNLLYLQSVPMTEPVSLAALMGLLYFTVRGSAVGAGICALAGALTRYEHWFLLPFVAAYFLLTSPRRVRSAVVFCAIAGLGPLYWLAHNAYVYSDPLYFYHGPYSARAIQGAAGYPGRDDWPKAFLYFRTAARLCAGFGLYWAGVAGLAAALARRAWWPLLLLALPAGFYVLSVHSSGTPIFVPELWPHSYYNSRYGLAALPLLALGAAALAAVAPGRYRGRVAAAVVLAALVPWLIHPRQEAWITWKESQVNSAARRNWTRQAAAYLGPLYRRGDGIYTQFGDLTGIWRLAGIPLRETFTPDNGLEWEASFRRPDLFLHEEWTVAIAGDPAQTVLTRAKRPYPNYPDYDLVMSIIVKGAPVIEIYRRRGSYRESIHPVY